MTIRFTATADSHGTHIFRNEDDFLVYLDSLWRTHSWGDGKRRYQAEKLWEKEPASYPCLMITNGTMSNSDGPDWVINHFLYDVVIEEGLEETENAWRFEDAA